MNDTIAISYEEFDEMISNFEEALARIGKSKGANHFCMSIGENDCQSVLKYDETATRLCDIIERYYNLLETDVNNLKLIKERFKTTDENAIR